ncbi:uncharacterized protein BYT42DRAFT_544921 [Radiomyces spectabilis]|uniref:uncharacterized protein n=1 Tax=Radiomyces spectabilis TaxID=64574 RepID=UPI00221EBAD2|nr:uncharacterized protein BYT42DRAFT_544921 [Radiomyces spectabilis]KAI8380953.1 hypothetical protein BYT42DRAFT_544921 [Radiomyces spectabilis]
MGTGLASNANSEDEEGIVPRCIVELFRTVQQRVDEDPDYSYEIYVSFLELYNEELIDLLNPQTMQKKKSGSSTSAVEVTIREDIAGNVYWSGVKEERCYSPEELLGFLAKGSLCRTTGSTDMNTVSSRSHAIFSVILKQQRPEENGNGKVAKSLVSKFHFVDLAGSERLKRTNAQGDRAKEGIAINAGLLALGNVISALGDEHRRAAHIPYRDSKLTRLLQDSLGGNSRTLMLACVSPSDTNFMETLNTLKYANRARNIKNRVTINQDFAGSSIEVNQLRALVTRLRMELASMRAEDATDHYAGSANHRENDVRTLKAEMARLRERLQDMSAELIQATSERDTLLMERELGEFMENASDEPISDNPVTADETTSSRLQTHPMIVKYQRTIQELTNELSDTRDRLTFLENVKPSMQAMAMASTLPTHSASFSSSTKPSTEASMSGQRRRRTVRRRRQGKLSATSSATSMTAHSIRSTRRSNVPRIAARTRTSSSVIEYEDEDEGFSQDSQEHTRQEVKDHIAKARADIRKSMEILQLIKPLEESPDAWENELTAFKQSEESLHRHTPSDDEGMFSSASSPVEPNARDMLDEIQSLAVSVWDQDEEAEEERSTAPSEDRAAFSNTEGSSMSSYPDSKPSSLSRESLHFNSKLTRMLHQIQSDIKVKEELVSHLEKSETEYTYMRRKFDDKIHQLQSQLCELQKERDTALMRLRSNIATKADISNQVRERQQSIEIRHAYEAKTKALLAEIHELKRKYAQTNMTMQSHRNQNETMLKSLKVNVETLKMEKKRMIKRMKQETERVKEQMTMQERRIQQLQRQQMEANSARRRLEREHEAQKLTLKKRNEEVMINASQLKQLTNILKKAVREGGVLDERLLGKVSHIMGGSFAILTRGNHGFSRRFGRKKINPIPVHIRATRKKELLDKAVGQYIQGKQALVEMEQLLLRRERLAEEKLELVEERKQVYLAEKQNAGDTGETMDTMALEFMDERIELISAEISYLSARIRALQSEAAGEVMRGDDGAVETAPPPRVEKHVTFADEIIADDAVNDEWADMDAFEEQYSVPSHAAPEMAYDMTTKLLKSLEADECVQIIEALVDDLMNLRMSECNRQVTMQNLEKTVLDLRRTLVVMKRAAIATTVENERRIRKLEDRNSNQHQHEDEDSAIDVKIEEYINNGNTIFDKIYEDGLRGLISTPEPAIGHDSRGSSAMSFDGEATITPSPTQPNLPINSVTVSGPPMDKMVRNMMMTRDLTPSPDRFYNMIQKRISWQQHNTDPSESPIPMTMANPAEFARYAADRDSSTSSIRSSHLRRSSLQSDFSSSQSQNSWHQPTMHPPKVVMAASQSLLRKRSHSLQQPPPAAGRRRASFRELSLMNDAAPLAVDQGMDPYQQRVHALPPSSSLAYPRQPSSRRSLPPLPPPSGVSMSTIERCGTPSSGNVFDRLSQTPTRASRAKMAHRHSSGSVDELRHRWETEQRSIPALASAAAASAAGSGYSGFGDDQEQRIRA